jgi:hypothetical protein
LIQFQKPEAFASGFFVERRDDAGTKIKITGSGDIYYTLDGSDPRAHGGARAKVAKKYDGAIVENGETKIFARALRGSSWSAPLHATFTAAQTARTANK